MTRAEKAKQLLQRCREKNYRVSDDGYVSTRVAAKLIGYSHFTLRNWRAGADQLPHRKPFGRHQYSLYRLAQFLLEDEDSARIDAAETHRNELDADDAQVDDVPMFPRRASR